MLLLVIAVGAMAMKEVEDWNFGVAVYYMWVSMSTIGYGDLEPNKVIGQASIPLNILIFLGLSMVAVFVGSVQDWIQSRLSNVAVSIEQGTHGGGGGDLRPNRISVASPPIFAMSRVFDEQRQKQKQKKHRQTMELNVKNKQREEERKSESENENEAPNENEPSD